ncbi:MAG: HAMP domain-containing sensor histidine kinase [Gemmatimonadota bacterium]|nr:HAMP domain-containing sensor histidine kinase [Gemmatimonadota bacterium]
MTAAPRPAAPLARLRLRLTAWYLGTMVVILLLLGGGLFVTIRGQLSSQLDASLADATAEIARAAATREVEAATARGQVVDAVEELRIPERQLFLFDGAGHALVPAATPEWAAVVARAAARDSVTTGDHDVGEDHAVRYRGERATLPSGTTVIAVAAADRVELEDRYASLIAAFGAAAIAGLALAGAGGWLLVRKSTAPAETTMERMRQFMADAAHELRTPVTALRSRADVALQRERGHDELVDTIRVVGAEAGRLGRIVDDLMTLARADAGERQVEMRRLSLDDVALHAADAARAMADARGVKLAVAEFEEAWVNGDEGLLHQLLMILLDNAVKFTPSGGTVAVRVGTTNGQASVAVADTGQGISAEDLPHIFDRFFRGDGARTRVEGRSGAGLGLSIAKWIAELHGAAISVDSSVDRGAEFRVTFPVPSHGPAA